MANKQIRREIYITANGKVAEDVLKALDTYAQKLDKDIEKLIKDGKADTKECKEMVAVRKSLSKQMKDNISDTQRIDKVMKDLAGSSTRQLRSALNAVRREIEKTSEADGRLDGLRKQFKAIKKQIDKNTGAANQHGSAWKTALKNLTAYVGFFGAFKILKQHLTDIIRLNFKLSDQLADIRKVSGWAMEDVDALSKRLAKIDTRNSIQQLNDLAYQGAKLGIGKYGVDGLTRFAEATAQIRMALHEDMGDEAIAQLAKMAEVMHDMESMGVSKALLASGSAIFKLGATTTATGSNIMEFSKRLLGLGKTADLTTPQILALGSAADSMALMPEVASTAFNKFITTLQSKYAQVAQAVGMNQERLKSLLDQHKTMDAIVEVLEHMRDMGDLNALAPIMGDLGSEGARLTNVFASMASNVQMLKDHLATSTEEFEKATAVTAEFDIQNETAQALMERASNIWEKTFVNSENAAGGIKDVARAWYDMTKAITESGSFLLEAGLSLKVLLWSIQALIGAIPALINGLIYLGVVKAASWGGWSVMFNAAAASATRFGTSLANLVGIQTAAQKSAIAAANDHIADAEAMMLEAAEAVSLAREQALLIGTEEELTAMKAAEAAATADLVAAQQLLATTIGEAAAATGGEVTTMLADSQAKTMDAFATRGLSTEELFFAESEGVVTAATTAQTAAIERDTAAKATNTATSKNLRLAWGALIFIGFVAVIDKLYENFKKLNEQEEKNKEINDKIVNGLVNANKEYEDACKNLKTLFGELERNWKIEDERKRLIGEINSRYGEYIGNIVTEQTEVANLAGKYQDATDALKEYYFYKQKEALKADLVAEPKHEAEKSLMKLQQMDFEDNPAAKNNFGNRQFLLNAIEDMYKGKKDSNQAAQELWRMMTGESVPGNFYTDLSKIPLVGGMFPKDTFRSDAQEAMSYLYDVTKQYYSALNNDALIEHNFPGEWKAPERPNKNSKNNTTPTAPDGETVKNDIAEFIANIKNFYKRQKTAFLDAIAEDPEVDEAMRDNVVQAIDERLERALENARLAIVLGKKEWDTWKQTMDKDIKEKADDTGQSQSTMLLEKIQGYDTANMRKQLLSQHYKLKKKKLVENPVADARDRAYMDKMWLAASGDDEKIVNARLKATKERKAASLERDYVGKVDEAYVNKFSKFGFAPLTDEEVQTIAGGGDAMKKLISDRRRDIIGMFTLARDRIVEVFEIESDKLGEKAQQDALLAIIFGADWQNNTTAKKIQQELGNDVASWKEFYGTLIDYSEAYTEAEKKEYQAAKKRADFMWQFNRRKMAEDKQMREMQNDAKAFGKRTNFASNLGLADLTADPEVELMKLKMQMAEDYYAFVKKNSQNQQLIDEADKARQEAQLAYVNQMATAMKERLSQMKALVNPVIDFGSAMGEALAQMRDDAEGANEAIKSALKSMLKSWGEMLINDLGTQMWKGINDAGAKRAAKKAQPAIDQAQKRTGKDVKAFEPDALASKATDVIGDVLTDTGSQQTEQEVEMEAAKYEKLLALEADYMDMSLEQWKAYADMKREILGEGSADGSEGGSSVIDQKQAENDALLALQEEQNKAMINLHNIGQSAANAAIKKGLNLQFKIRKKANKDAEKDDAKTKDAMVDNAEQTEEQKTDIIDAGATVQMAAQTALNTKVLTASKAANTERVQGDAATTEAETTLSIVEAMAKCFSFLGPIAGPIMAGVVQALLMGLLQWGLSKALGGGSDSKKDTTKGPNTKLVSGMLTYDQGNVQDLKPFFDKDGNMYWATEDNDRNHDGINLLTKPTATTINGQPSLVAEQGPELVIGRETTQAIMQNNPALLKALYQYDKHHSGRVAYDAGNLTDGETSGTVAALGTVAMATQGAVTIQRDPEMLALMTALLARLNEPITASINMYGRGGLYEQQKHAQSFMKGK